MKIRNHHRRIFVYALAAILGVGCASTASETAEEPHRAEGEAAQEAKPKQEDSQTARATADGPFEVAVGWASELPAEAASEEVRQLVGEWQSGRVARVWASERGYRAVVVQKSTARETPAVLLYIVEDDAGEWSVAGARPTTSTHLWSEL